MAEDVRGDEGAAPHPLTERELVVLELLVGGRTDPEIADALGVSEQTVSIHRSRIFGKLGVASRAEAAAWVRANRPFGDSGVDA